MGIKKRPFLINETSKVKRCRSILNDKKKSDVIYGFVVEFAIRNVSRIDSNL